MYMKRIEVNPAGKNSRTDNSKGNGSPHSTRTALTIHCYKNGITLQQFFDKRREGRKNGAPKPEQVFAGRLDRQEPQKLAGKSRQASGQPVAIKPEEDPTLSCTYYS